MYEKQSKEKIEPLGGNERKRRAKVNAWEWTEQITAMLKKRHNHTNRHLEQNFRKRGRDKEREK